MVLPIPPFPSLTHPHPTPSRQSKRKKNVVDAVEERGKKKRKEKKGKLAGASCRSMVESNPEKLFIRLSL